MHNRSPDLSQPSAGSTQSFFNESSTLAQPPNKNNDFALIHRKIRRPLFRGATRLRSISSILYPVSSVSFILHPGFFVSLYSCMFDVVLCILDSAASNLAVDSAPGNHTSYPPAGGAQDLGCLRVAMKNHQISSPSPGHQKS